MRKKKEIYLVIMSLLVFIQLISLPGSLSQHELFQHYIHADRYSLDQDLHSSQGNDTWYKKWGIESEENGATSVKADDTGVYTCVLVQDYENSTPVDYYMTIEKRNHSGSLIWNNTWNTSGRENPRDMWLDDNSIYVLATTSPYAGAKSDLLLIKWDKNGTEIWNRTWAGPESDSALRLKGDMNGSIYTCGHTESYSVGNDDMLLVKWNATTGDPIWNRTWGRPYNDGIKDLVCDEGYIYTVGYDDSWGGDNVDIVIIKWDVNGTIIWNETWSTAYTDVPDAILMQDGSLYIFGSFTDNEGDGFSQLIKWDPISGTEIWNRTWLLSEGPAPGIVDVCTNGTEMYACGWVLYSITYLYLAKIDTEGNVSWARFWGQTNYAVYGYGVWSNDTCVYTCGKIKTYLETRASALLVKWDAEGNAPTLPIIDNNGDEPNGDPPNPNPIIIVIIIISIGVVLLISMPILYQRKRKKTIQESPPVQAVQAREQISPEELAELKNKNLCIVHKGPIEGFSYICPGCGVLYCRRCLDALIQIENKCWSCGIPLDKTKIMPEEELAEEQRLVSDSTETPEDSRKKNNIIERK
ncbi:MAG: hypothetical protein ACFFCS_14595 [Candidatus Hodarchaeota archaeon]